jgi:hypothetical protein
MGAHSVDIGISGKQVLGSKRDFEEGCGAVLVEMSIQQQDGFLSPGRTKPAQKEDGTEGTEHLDDLMGIGKSRNAADEDLPESRVEAREQKK